MSVFDGVRYVQLCKKRESECVPEKKDVYAYFLDKMFLQVRYNDIYILAHFHRFDGGNAVPRGKLT